MTEPQKHELELLKGAANEPYEKGKGKWSRLLKVLQLSTAYVPAIQEILKQGKWQNQPNSIGYVRKAAVRRTVRHGLVEIRRKRGHEALPPEISSEHERLGEEYKLITELCDLDQQKRQPLVRLLSQEVLNREVVKEAEEVDWERVARLANLDPGERIVLDLKLMGLKWREAIAACLTAADRSILNTAWRRFDRHKNVVKQAPPHGQSSTRRAKNITA